MASVVDAVVFGLIRTRRSMAAPYRPGRTAQADRLTQGFPALCPEISSRCLLALAKYIRLQREYMRDAFRFVSFGA
jgi:hypothetical protein